MEKAMIEAIAKAIVSNPDEVEVKEVEGEESKILELRVDSEDIGRIIGKQGRTSRAIRSLLHTVSVRTGKRLILEILD